MFYIFALYWNRDEPIEIKISALSHPQTLNPKPLPP